MSATDGESIAGSGHIVCDLYSSNVVFSELSSAYPLKLLSPKVAEPGVAIVYMMSYGGGLVGGDRVHLTVKIGRGCKLLLLSQVRSCLYCLCMINLRLPHLGIYQSL